MKSSRQTLFLLWLGMLLSACIPATPAYTPIPPFTTAVPSVLPSLVPTLAPTATTAALNPTLVPLTFTTAPSVTPFLPTDTPTSPKPSGFTPILLQSKLNGKDFFLLGGVNENGWYDPTNAAANLNGHLDSGNPLDFFARGKAMIESKGTHSQSPTCNLTFVHVEADIPIEARIGVRPEWPVTFPALTVIQANTPAYQDAVSAWLISQGLTSPEVKILQIWRVDLESDNTNEVLISAARFKETTGHMTELGDYSVVLLRKVVGNSVVTIPLVADIYRNQQPALTFPKTYSLINVADLNGDGIAEILVDMAYWEGLGAMIYEVKQNKATQLLRANCP